MKLSQKQAELLAKEIHERLLKAGVNEVSPLLKAKIEKFKDDRDRLIDAKSKAEKAIDEHDKKLAAIIGKDNMKRVRCYYDSDNIIEKLEESNTPTISEITDKIILKAMFTSADEMESFVDELVKQFSKKKKVTASAN